MGGEELKWRQLAHNQLMSPQRPHFSPYSIQLIPIIEAQISGKLVSSGISDVSVHFSILGQNPSEEVDDYDNYYYYDFIARNDRFDGSL